jgi:hypothetical protein
MHPAWIEPHKEGLLVAVCPIDEIRRSCQEFLVDCFHALFGERTSIFALLLTPGTEPGIVARRVGRDCSALHHATRPKLRLERWILRIVRIFRFIFGIQMIEVAEELVETMHGGQEFIAIPEMILAELSGRVSLWLQKLGDGGVLT